MSKPWLHLYHVEDDAGDRDLLQMAIRKTGFQIHLETAVDGEEAFHFLKKCSEPNLPQIILLDLNLPRKDGRELLKDLKSHPRLKLIPVVILTTSNAPTDIETCYEQGAACFLVKPIDFAGLTHMVTRLVEFWNSVELLPLTAKDRA